MYDDFRPTLSLTSTQQTVSDTHNARITYCDGVCVNLLDYSCHWNIVKVFLHSVLHVCWCIQCTKNVVRFCSCHQGAWVTNVLVFIENVSVDATKCESLSINMLELSWNWVELSWDWLKLSWDLGDFQSTIKSRAWTWQRTHNPISNLLNIYYIFKCVLVGFVGYQWQGIHAQCDPVICLHYHHYTEIVWKLLNQNIARYSSIGDSDCLLCSYPYWTKLH